MYYLISVPDSERAKSFYGKVFGWTYRSRGDYHHISGSSPGGGILGGEHKAGIKPSFVVADIKEALRVAGAEVEAQPSQSGWNATVKDGQGREIGLWQPSEAFANPNPRCGVGDLYYFVVPVEDEEGKEFYGTLLNWEYTTGHVPGGFNIANSAPPGGLFVGGGGEISLYFRVDDVEAAAVRIREAGGTAGATEPNSAGWHAACQDDQGVSFSIGALREH